jgi:hypothetical protein
MSSNKVPDLMRVFQNADASNSKVLNISKPLDQFENGPLKDTLVFGYNSGSLFDQAIAVLINASVSSKKAEFFLSRRLMIQYFNQDPNVKNRDLSGEQMRVLLGRISQVGLIERITKPSGYQSGKRIASVFRVAHPEILAYISDGASDVPLKVPT